MPHPSIPKTAIFLGAGASAAEGAPIQSTLFYDYFQLLRGRRGRRSTHENALMEFFDKMFGIDVKDKSLQEVMFPTFEEALGILDIADLRSEAFRDFPGIDLSEGSGRIKHLRLYLVLLLADIINHKLRRGRGVHRSLIHHLKSARVLDNVFFISTNYDIACDNALYDLFPDYTVDYGIDFVNFLTEEWEAPDDTAVSLFKLHGSLNWLYCPTCNNMRLTPRQKGVYKLIVNPDDYHCESCHSLYSPLIVPPTFFKDFSRLFLNQVWNRAENELRDTKHIIFCGYSFPDADLYIKYLLKRIQTNRSQNDLRISVVNHFDGKDTRVMEEEKNRFERFLGKPISYTAYSFEEFATNPVQILKQRTQTRVQSGV